MLKRNSAHLWIAAGLILITFFVYAQVRTHSFVNYDDPRYVAENSHVRDGLTWDGVVWAFTSADDANWIPLTRISHMVDCQLFGLESGMHHLVSVALHGLSAVFLFLLLVRMTGALWRSAFVGAVFALHPLHVESVAWIAERKDVLCGLFWILAIWAYVRYVERPAAGRYALVIFLFCCGLLSKPMIVTLPVMLLLLDFWPLKRMNRSAILEKIPLFALSAAVSAITYMAQHRGGALIAIDQAPVALRIENALVQYWVYIFQFFWPAKLAVFYPYPASFPSWEVAIAGLGLAAATALALVEFSRRPYLTVGWLWYIITLLPVIGLVQVGLQARADRYTYIPIIGISIMLAWGITGVAESLLRFDRSRDQRERSLPGTIACMLALAAWSAVTWLQIGYWRDSISLFQHAIAVTDRNYVAYNNLGAAQWDDGRSADAIPNFQAALQIKPRYPDALSNLGQALLNQGHALEALPYLSEAVQLEPRRMDAHFNLGRVYGMLGRTGDAIAQFTEVIREKPDDAEAHFNLGTAFASRQSWNEAIDQFRAAVRVQPDYVDAHFNLGAALASTGKFDEAIVEFSGVLRLRPGFTEARQALEQCQELRSESRK